MKITEIRAMMDLIKKFTEEVPFNVEKETELSDEELKHYKDVQAALDKQEFVNTFKRFAFYKPEK
jgi:tRNA isopentenyl-2-thiomethyl-A-37 hydroxylase MiaE